MKRLILAAVTALTLTCTPVARADPDPMVEVVTEMIAAFNALDVPGFVALHTDAPTILDEPPPYLFAGETALDDWLTALVAYDEARGRSNGRITLGRVHRAERSGDRGYVVVDVRYSYLENGVPLYQNSRLTATLWNTADGWRVSGWSWGGTAQSEDD